MFLIVALLACTDPTPELVVAPGVDGPSGACRVELSAQARVTERVRYALTFPCVDADTPAYGPPKPVAGLVQGGLVAPDRYGWLSAHLATHGWAVVRPEHPLDLAIDQTDNTTIAAEDLRWRASGSGLLQGLVDDEQPTAILGHSLGGVVAAMQWTAHPDAWDGLAILASYPADGTGVEGRTGPVLSLMGDTEDPHHLENFEASQERFQGPTLWGRVQGMNHFAWTDDPNPGEIEGDGPLERDLDEIRADVLLVMDTWLDAELLADEDAAARIEEGDFPGIEVLP